MNLAQPWFSDTLPGRNHANLKAEASEYMEKALFSLSYHETSTFPFMFLDIIYFLTQGLLLILLVNSFSISHLVSFVYTGQ